MGEELMAFEIDWGAVLAAVAGAVGLGGAAGHTTGKRAASTDTSQLAELKTEAAVAKSERDALERKVDKVEKSQSDLVKVVAKQGQEQNEKLGDIKATLAVVLDRLPPREKTGEIDVSELRRRWREDDDR